MSEKAAVVTDGSRPEILVSIDGEFTGAIPGPHSMISLGAVAFDQKGVELSRYKVNLKELPGTTCDEIRKAWWAQHPEAWAAATKDPVDPELGIRQFTSWLEALPGAPKLIGWPLCVDFMFVYWYCVKCLGIMPPFGYDGINIKTYAMCRLGTTSLSEVSKTRTREMLGIAKKETSHDALADAIEQAELFFCLRHVANGN